MAFAPARSRIQVLVDRAFFRRATTTGGPFSGSPRRPKGPTAAPDLLALFSATLDEALPVEKVGAFVPAPGAGAPGDRPPQRARRRCGRLPSRPRPPARMRPCRPTALQRLGFETALPLPLGDGGPSGWVFIGPKRSGLKFTDEDRELLRTLTVEMAAALRRIRLQEEVIYERASREKLEEIGRLKTEFISAVSHELRTPMTSLQAISELLKSGKVDDASRREHLLELMAGECGRLGRYLHNVLDFGRIEQDAKSYEIRETDLKPVVAGVVEVVRSAAAEEDLDLEVRMPDGSVLVEADPDAVRQALLNLVDNAIKYSAGRKRVAVRLAATADGAEISVSDSGIGIAPEDRDTDLRGVLSLSGGRPARSERRRPGAEDRQAHHGRPRRRRSPSRARPGRGTTITLKFPRRRRP